jgi:hypothetical protein
MGAKSAVSERVEEALKRERAVEKARNSIKAVLTFKAGIRILLGL